MSQSASNQKPSRSVSKKPRTFWIVLGAAVSFIGLFLPLLTFSSLTLDFSASVWDLAHVPNGGYWWAFIACPVALVGGVVLMKPNPGFADVLFKVANFGHGAGLLWSAFQSVESGSVASSVADQHYLQTGHPIFFAHASLQIGFWLLAVGFLIAAYGIYMKKEE